MILVDTHVVVWLAFQPDRLSKKAVIAIEDAYGNRDGLAISALSLYELAMIATRGRIRLDVSVESFVQEIEARFVVKPLTGRISVRAMQLPETYPSDPIDRIIGATALVEGLHLITADESIRKSKALQTIW